MQDASKAGIATRQQPLGAVIDRVGKWFNNEREHRREVRGRMLNARVKYELEYERGRQLVLEQKEADTFKRFVLQACQRKLQSFRVVNAEKKASELGEQGRASENRRDREACPEAGPDLGDRV